MTDIDLEQLADALADFAPPPPATGRSPREERLIAGFEDIQRFVTAHGHAPRHGAEHDIFERLYAVRLDRLRALPEGRAVLEPLDYQGLLAPQAVATAGDPELDADQLAAALAEVGERAGGSLTRLQHVRASADKRAAEDIASRQPCKDFARFEPLFAQVQRDLDSGHRRARPFGQKAEIEAGRFFILGGQKAYVAEVGELFTQDYGDRDARLRVIFDNGTESNLLMRSLQRALTKDAAGRRITDPSPGPLFDGIAEEGDTASGTIYVLRSHSDLPLIAANRELIHKIGVTGGKVTTRIANAAKDATYLLADVDVVATYTLSNINRTKLENLFHRIFGVAQLDLTIEDRFGNPVKPREWFLVPLQAIDEAVNRIRDGSITQYVYDPKSARLVLAK